MREKSPRLAASGICMKKLKCCGCKNRFPADTMLDFNGSKFHDLDCVTAYSNAKGKKLRAKQQKDKVVAESKEHRLALKNLREGKKSWQMNKTKTICHKYIRERDADLPCISCGRYEHEIDFTGWDHMWDAGHFLSRGSHPELRFTAMNIHKQCVKCNTAPNLSGQSRTVKEAYRANLIQKIGISNVEWLEGPHIVETRTIEELKEIQAKYSKLTKEMEKDNV